MRPVERLAKLCPRCRGLGLVTVPVRPCTRSGCARLVTLERRQGGTDKVKYCSNACKQAAYRVRLDRK